MKKVFFYFFLFVSITACGDSVLLEKGKRKQNQSRYTSLMANDFLALADYRMHMYWKIPPNVAGEAILVLVIVDSQNRPVDIDGDLKVDIWMPDMGHGGAFIPTLSRESEGIYRVSDLWYYMTGLWETTFEIWRDGKTTAKTVWQITL